MTTSKSFVYGKLDGEQEVLKILRKARKELVDAKIIEALKAGGELIKDEAMRRAPVGSRPPRRGVRTGRLKRSLQVYNGFNEIMLKKFKRIQVEAWYPENAMRYKNGAKHRAAGAFEYYAFAVEYGTRYQSKKPFLHPALEAKKNEVEKIIIKEFEDLINDVS